MVSTCRICGKRFSFLYFRVPKDQWGPCPGNGAVKGKVITGKNARLTIDGKVVQVFDKMEFSGEWPSGPQIYTIGEVKACECGAAKTGVQNYKPGHSAWCPVKETG